MHLFGHRARGSQQRTRILWQTVVYNVNEFWLEYIVDGIIDRRILAKHFIYLRIGSSKVRRSKFLRESVLAAADLSVWSSYMHIARQVVDSSWQPHQRRLHAAMSWI